MSREKTAERSDRSCLNLKSRETRFELIPFRTSRQCSNGERRIGGAEDDLSSETNPVISPTNDSNPLCLVNGHGKTRCLTSEQTKRNQRTIDPWIRRVDQPMSNDSINVDRAEKSVQYESRPYYRSLSSTSDDYPCHHHHHRQATFPTTNVDKDIEYVESRLRGQTTVSLPTKHSRCFTDPISWTTLTSHPPFPLVSSTNENEQITPIYQQTSLTIEKQTNNNEKISSTTTPSKSSTYESVKTVKRRIEKLKDQKAAKTLRLVYVLDWRDVSRKRLFLSLSLSLASAILIAFIVTWLPYNTNIVISTIKPDIFNQGLLMYWERFGYMLCYINSTIK